MAKRMTETEAIEKIKERLEDNVEFIGLVGNWKGTTGSKFKFRCKKHNKEFTITSTTIFYKESEGSKIWCPDCRIERDAKMKSEKYKMDESDALKRINEFLSLNPHLEYLGMVGDYDGAKNTVIKLKCKIHNTITETKLEYVFKSRYYDGTREHWKCPKCVAQQIADYNKYTPEKAKEVLEDIFKDSTQNFSFEKVLTTFTGYKNPVTIVCPKHGDFEETFRILTSKNINIDYIRCPKCREENIISKIESAIKYKNDNLGTDLTFLGFVGGKYTTFVDSKLLIRCNIHNITFESTIPSVVQYPLNPTCPVCTAEKENHISNCEKLCLSILKKYCDKTIDQQYTFKTFDKICNKNRRFNVDFYIKDLNLIIEYDGEQHYNYCSFYYNDYSAYVNQVNRDNCLNQYCKENSINILRISYKDKKRIEEVIKAYFEEGKDITTKVDPILLPIKYEGGNLNG